MSWIYDLGMSMVVVGVVALFAPYLLRMEKYSPLCLATVSLFIIVGAVLATIGARRNN